MQEIIFDRFMDVLGSGLARRPFPGLQATDEAASGEILKIVAADMDGADDFRMFARHAHLTLLASNERDGQFQFFIRKP